MNELARLYTAALTGFCVAGQIALNIYEPSNWPLWVGFQTLVMVGVIHWLRRKTA